MTAGDWNAIELPPPAPPKVLAWRYLFAGVTHGRALWPVLVVATEGGAGDWAAYVAGVSLHERAPEERDDPLLAHVARWGHKLTEDAARGFFPELATGRSYRP